MGRLAEGKSVQEKYGGPLQQVRHWHKAMARAAVAAGRRPGELSQIFGISKAQVSKILASPLFVAEVERLEAMAELEVVDMASELPMRQSVALKNIDEGLVQKDLGKRVDLSLEVLDRTGYGKNPNVQKHLHLHKNVVENMSDDELDNRIENLLDDRKEREEEEEDLSDALEAEIVSNEKARKEMP